MIQYTILPCKTKRLYIATYISTISLLPFLRNRIALTLIVDSKLFCTIYVLNVKVGTQGGIISCDLCQKTRCVVNLTVRTALKTRPSKHETFTLCRANVGPASETVAQH